MPGTLDDALAVLDQSTEGQADTQASPSYSMPAPAKQPGTIDDALNVLDTQEQTDQLRGQVEVGSKQDPARSTKVLQLFGKTGLPKDFIDRNLDYVNQEAAKQNFDPAQLQKDSPAFASWLAESPDHVAAAAPDASKLSFIEKQLKNIPAQFEQGQRTVEYGNVMLDVVKGLIDKTDVTALRKRQAELETAMSQPDDTGLAEMKGPAGVLQRAPGWMSNQLPILASTLEEQLKTGAAGVAIGATAGGIVGGLPGAAIGGTVTGGAAWRMGAAINSAKMEFAQAFGDYEKLKDEHGQPLDQQTAMGLAGIVGVVNGAIDGYFGIEGLTSKLPGINQFSRQGVKELLKTPTARTALLSYAKVIGQTMAVEGATEAIQMYITKTGGVLLQALKDGGSPTELLGKVFTQENFQQALTEAEAGAMGGGGIGAVMASPQVVADLTQVRQANRTKQTFEAIGKATESTKMAQDLPGPLKDIIARATEHGPVEDLYVPQHAFAEYFQKEGVDPREVYQEITGNVDAYDQAVQTGADLPIKTSDYVQKLAGTRHNDFFANEIRTSPDAMNASEAAEWVKQQDEIDKASQQQSGLTVAPLVDQHATVKQDITGQLVAAGMPLTVADQYAALYAARYQARAERRGLGENPADLFAKQNLTITNQVPEILKTLGQHQSELDALLERLRNHDLLKPAEVYGQSLHDFLKQQGGVQDQGGELKARNVDQARKPFQKGLVQKKGLTLDEAAQRAVEAGYLDTRDINALLDAIDKEARGTPVFAVGKENAAALDVQNNLDSLKAYLDAKGIDLAKTPNADIKKMLGEAVQQTLPTVEGQTFAQAAQWQSPAFKSWFGDSKVVDEHGNPLVVYHGTGEKGLRGDAFDKTLLGSVTKSRSAKAGFFFVTDRDVATGYSRLANEKPVADLIAQSQAAERAQKWDLAHDLMAQAEKLEATASPKEHVIAAYLSIQNPLEFDAEEQRFLDIQDEIHDTIKRAKAGKHDGLVIRNLIDNADWGSDLATDHWVAFESSQIKSATSNVGTFDATNPNILSQGDGTPKGSITFGDNQVNIKLLEKADLSTFIHETGHLYLNELLADAQAVEAVAEETRTPSQSQIIKDRDTLNAWMKRTDPTAPLTVAQHEQFARGFEAYTMEGKSPSQAMRDVFAQFRQWLIQAYRSLTTAPLNVKLTQGVREVMDRLIATDEQIDQAAQAAEVHPLFLDAESAGMTPTQFAAYKETVAKASLTARETLQKQLMAQLQRQNEEWWKTEREALRLHITDQVNQHPEYVTLSVLQTGTMPDGSSLPAGVEPMKLDRNAIAAQFGKDFLSRLPRGITSKNGMHQDAAAQIFGFNSGQDLVMALVNARPKLQLINAEADAQMQSKYGDMRFDGTIADAAKAAVLNAHQEEVIAAEIRALNKKQQEVKPFVQAAANEAKQAQQQGRALLRTVIPTLEDTRTLARNILARTTLKQLNPFAYSVAARQASKHATAALSKQDYLDAGLFKQRELLNLALFREATIIKEQVEKTHALAAQFGKADATLAKSRNVDLVNVGRAILAQYGLARPVEKTAADYLAPIKTYDADLYDQWKPQVDALAPRPVDYNALTVDEFQQLHDNLAALWLLSRRTKQALINGQLVDRAAMVDELNSVIASYTPQQQAHVVGKQTAWDNAKMGLMSWKSALTRVESWVEGMDAGNINGPFRRLIWTPISEATDKFKNEQGVVIAKYQALTKTIEGTITRDLIPAPELGPNVAFRGKGALLHAILHTGNESNQSKLLRGYHWTPTGWQTFLDRMYREKVLTKADYDYAQGVWKLLESLKPDAQQAHHEMYGYYFNEITARPITTPFGEYPGGYVPAIADRNLSVDQAIREEKDLFDQAGNSFMFPTTGRGFTKGRVETYAAPLALDLTTISVHLNKVLRFTYLEPRVKDAARLVTNKQFRAALDAMNSTVAKDMLVPWLQRSAQQTVASPGKNRHADALWRYMRRTVGAQIMVGNVLNTLQQFTGWPIALTKVEARYLRGSMVSYLTHPVQYTEDVYSKSMFMKNELHTQVIDIQSNIDEVLLNPSKYERVKDFMAKHGYILQQATQNIVSLTTWGAAYDQAIAKGQDEQTAMRSADAAVRLTQGSFSPVNISAFEGGTPFVRAFTMFYSYFNMQANLLGTEFGKIATQQIGLRKGAGRAFYVYLVGFMAPAVLSELLIKGVGGFDPEDDDNYLNEVLSTFFGSQLRTALAMIPGVGPITLAGIGAFTSKQYDDRISTSPIVTTLEAAVRAPHSLYQAMSEDGHAKRAIRDVLTLIGVVTGLPVGSLARPLGYLGDVADGVAQPETAGDVARGLLSGKDVNRTK